MSVNIHVPETDFVAELRVIVEFYKPVYVDG